MGEIHKSQVDAKLAQGAKVFGFRPCNGKYEAIGEAIYFEAADEQTALDWLEIEKETGRVIKASFYQILNVKPSKPAL